jgi:very-short-patch-repair endonuclease
VPTTPARPPQLAGRVFRGSTAVAAGWLTRKQLRSSAWVRLRRDVYADASLPVTYRLRISAIGLSLPDGAGFAGRSAAVLWGALWAAGAADPVEVVLPPGARWNPGADVRVRSMLPGRDLVRRGRWAVTSRVDTTVDLIRFADTTEAVVLLDRLVRERVVRLDDVRRATEDLPRCWGSGRAREVAALADGLAESQQETRLRLLMRHAGLPAPVAQFRVRDADGVVARVDFAYPEVKLAIEYDGMWHGERTAFLDDRRRLNRLVAAGWVVVHVTAEDLEHPERFLARLRALHARRLRGRWMRADGPLGEGERALSVYPSPERPRRRR